MKTSFRSLLSPFAVLILCFGSSFAETAPGGSRTAVPVITEKIDTARMVTLHGNVRADLTAAHDLGPVEDGLPLRLYLVLQRTPERQAALDNLLARQQQPTAAEYHKWVTPAQFGERFGVSEQDIAKITAWLEAQGMHVNGVMNNASFIDFTATARDVREVFGTQLHYFEIDGKHPALVQDPKIPAALAQIVAGIQGLNKIPAHVNHTKTGQAAWDATAHHWKALEPADGSAPTPLYLNPNIANEYDVTPQDFYTIYNVNPVFNSGTKGATATIAVVEETDIVYGTVNGTTGAATGGDVVNFRTLFGVPGTLNMHVYHGYGSVTCNDPGIDPNGNGEQGEAALDAEWASAAAPAANLIFMSCDQTVDNGIISSEAALIDNNLADVMSLSYGHSELSFSSTDFSSQDTLYAQAAAQGQSFIVSTGDAGSDAADQNTTGTATSGFNVSALSASPLVTTAGGTDFVDLVDQLEGGSNQSIYWGATNSANYADALGYVPETAWNSSCADSILTVYEGYTGAGYCAQPGALGVDGSVVGGTGGFSTHYAVPAYQTGITGYTGTKRAQPDISSFAASGFYSHALIYCDSHVPAQSCSSSTTFATSGGTSFVAPQFAGVFGLLVNYTGSRQGLLNPALYALAKAQFTASATKSACYSNGTTVNAGVVTASLPASTCTFNDVTSGNNDVPCVAGSTNCFVNAGATDGMLSLTGSTSLTVAYPSTPGYDEVAGIGTLNVNNLLANWNKAFTSTAKVASSLTSMTSTQSTTLTATVTGGTPTGFTGPVPAVGGTATFKAGTTTLGNCTLSGGTCTLAVSGSSLAAGSNSITATFSGSKTYPSSTSTAVTVTVTGGTGSTITLSPTSLAFGNQVINTSTWQSVTMTNSGTAAVSITSILVTGTDAASFFFTNGCSSSLAAGANCAISVYFEPTTTGAKSAAITYTDSDPGSPQTVTLTGTGTSAGSSALTFSPTSLAFGNVPVGTSSASLTTTMTNTGATAVSITSIALTGTNASAFAFANSCGTSLAAGANCTIHGHFAPPTAGAMTAAITVTDNATGSPQTVPLTGTGGSGASGTLSLSPTTLAFGNVPVGTSSASLSATLTNTGTTAVSITSIVLSGANASAFTFANSCGTGLAAGANCTIHGHFAPATAGAMTASFTITDNATGSPQILTLTGTGGSGTSPLSVSPASLSFGSINVASVSPGQVVTISNTTAAAITISSLAFTGANSSQFAVLSNCTTSLPASSSCTAMVSLLPTSTGALSAAFSVASSVGTGSVALSGTGIATAALTFSTTSVTFPNTTHGTQSLASVVTVTNSGTTTANFGFLGLGGANYADFYQLNSCGTTLAPGAKCSVFFIFRPAATGAFAATMEFFDNAQAGYQGIALSGTGN
jgi:subtilase family serine protease